MNCGRPQTQTLRAAGICLGKVGVFCFSRVEKELWKWRLKKNSKKKKSISRGEGKDTKPCLQALVWTVQRLQKAGTGPRGEMGEAGQLGRITEARGSRIQELRSHPRSKNKAMLALPVWKSLWTSEMVCRKVFQPFKALCSYSGS